MIAASNGNSLPDDFRGLVEKFVQSLGLSNGNVRLTLHQGSIEKLELRMQVLPLRHKPRCRSVESSDRHRSQPQGLQTQATLPQESLRQWARIAIDCPDLGSVVGALEPGLRQLCGLFGHLDLEIADAKMSGWRLGVNGR